mmetsp:Transcript_9821/g.17788  ORF Transcript_9821/g.17788 Transcript_9821/m.17788 type:complete len:104 (+) Transcript_9821:354-665(+)
MTSVASWVEVRTSGERQVAAEVNLSHQRKQEELAWCASKALVGVAEGVEAYPAFSPAWLEASVLLPGALRASIGACTSSVSVEQHCSRYGTIYEADVISRSPG